MQDLRRCAIRWRHSISNESCTPSVILMMITIKRLTPFGLYAVPTLVLRLGTVPVRYDPRFVIVTLITFSFKLLHVSVYSTRTLINNPFSFFTASIASRPGQSGRADGYILEGKELEFYLKKIKNKKSK